MDLLKISNVFGFVANWAWRPVFWGCSHCDNTPDREYSLNWGGESLLNVTTSFNMHQYGTLAVRDNSDGCYHNCAGRAAARRIFEQLDHQIQGEKMKTEVERFLLGQEANSQQCWRHLSIRHCHSGLPPPKKISWERYYYCTQYYRTLSDRCYCRLNCIWTASNGELIFEPTDQQMHGKNSKSADSFVWFVCYPLPVLFIGYPLSTVPFRWSWLVHFLIRFR